MDPAELKNLQSPLKEKYKSDPDSALITLRAVGKLGEGISCKVSTGKALAEAGLHPATGGDGSLACSGDMLLEALAACAGVTLNAVATAIGVEIKSGQVTAEGDLDFRGTLGVSKEAQVIFRNIRLTFALEGAITPEQMESLKKLTERYCVIYQTIVNGVEIQSQFHCKGN